MNKSKIRKVSTFKMPAKRSSTNKTQVYDFFELKKRETLHTIIANMFIHRIEILYLHLVAFSGSIEYRAILTCKKVIKSLNNTSTYIKLSFRHIIYFINGM